MIESEALTLQATRLIVDASRKFWTQTAVVFHDSPIRRNSFAPVGTIFLSSLSSDAYKITGVRHGIQANAKPPAAQHFWVARATSTRDAAVNDLATVFSANKHEHGHEHGHGHERH